MAYYTQAHRARLELIRALQDHGFTLSAIEKYLARVPADASVEDLALQRAMLTSWGAGKRESITRRQLETRARRKLGDDEIQRLVNIYAIRGGGRPLRAAALLRRGPQALRARHPGRLHGGGRRRRSTGTWTCSPTSSPTSCAPACSRRSGARSTAEADKAAFEQTMSRLRQLTLEAVVAGFQRAANQVITRSLSESSEDAQGLRSALASLLRASRPTPRCRR